MSEIAQCQKFCDILLHTPVISLDVFNENVTYDSRKNYRSILKIATMAYGYEIHAKLNMLALSERNRSALSTD